MSALGVEEGDDLYNRADLQERKNFSGYYAA
jgi:hypothetical protein